MYKTILCNKPEIREIYRGEGLMNVLFVCGTHGDEFAGDISVQNYDYSDVYDLNITICRVNLCGLLGNMRNNPMTGLDINRQYNKGDFYNKIVEDLVLRNDIIFDFHEGFDFNIINKNSIGSTLSTNSTNFVNLCEYIIQQLNNQINNKNKKFVFLRNKQEIEGSLQEYCTIHNKDYVLIETTKTEDLESRIIKNNIIIQSIIDYLTSS